MRKRKREGERERMKNKVAALRQIEEEAKGGEKSRASLPSV